jgi:glycosyltransferase involved in cell wall biosynthesis
MPDMVLRGQEPRFRAALRSLLARERFDIVQAESIEMAQYGRPVARAGELYQRHAPMPLFCYDAFNAEYVLQRRAFLTDLRHPRKLPAAAYSLLQWRKLLRYERRLARHFDLVLAVSEPDRRILQRASPDVPIAVVPNGVDTDFFQVRHPESVHREAPDHRPYLLFTGTLDFRPNIDAVRWFVDAIWPRVRTRSPALEFCIVGQRPAPDIMALNSRAGVRVVGPVDDVRPWFEGASAYVLPMRVGGGVRLKLLETFAMGLPCVTTSLGAEGLAGLEAGTHALVEDTPDGFAAAIERLLADRPLGLRLAQSGRRLVVQHYEWRAVVRRMEDAWNTHLAITAAAP